MDFSGRVAIGRDDFGRASRRSACCGSREGGGILLQAFEPVGPRPDDILCRAISSVETNLWVSPSSSAFMHSVLASRLNACSPGPAERMVSPRVPGIRALRMIQARHVRAEVPSPSFQKNRFML